MSPTVACVDRQLNKTTKAVKTRTFGEFIAGVYCACGRQRAKEIVQRAVNSRWIEFHETQRFMIS